MKISKLFHWLYALIMLLPIFAVGVTCAYVIFNKNAYQSYSQATNVSIVNVNGNYNNSALNNDTQYTFRYNGNDNTRIGVNVKDNQTNLFEVLNIDRESTSIRAWNSSALPNGDFYVDITYVQTQQNATLRFNINVGFEFECVVDGFISFWGNTPTTFNDLNFSISYVIYQIGKLDNVFYYSIDKVQQSSLFNWAYDSFLATPITYITNLFGIAYNHISVMLMSYWLAISVIWLVFDLIMYVPLLVHRWLDKGVLE